ncbi:MAG: hypothetical protein NUV35_08640, partial [Syntrophomonadaceae bacterium]|nr:hypothetical protein [Syntrophomonadaceae bacterium]
MGASWWRASFTYRLLRSSFLLGWAVAGEGLGPAPWLEGSQCARAASRLREGVERAAVRGA